MALRQILNDEGAGCDVFGHGELQAALWSGVPGDKISVNGSAKNARLIELAVSVGARITLDSEQELDLVIAATERQQRSARRPATRAAGLSRSHGRFRFFSGHDHSRSRQHLQARHRGRCGSARRSPCFRASQYATHGPHDPPRPAQRGPRRLVDDGADLRISSREVGRRLVALASSGTGHRGWFSSSTGSVQSRSVSGAAARGLCREYDRRAPAGTARRRYRSHRDGAADRAWPKPIRQLRNSFEPGVPCEETGPAGSAYLDRTRYHRDVSS